MENKVITSHKTNFCTKLWGLLWVFVYEFYATMMLVYAVCMCKEPLGIPLTLFAMLLIIGPVTGGHVNPAVTIGTFIHLGNYARTLIPCCVMLAGEFLGGMCGTGLYLATIYNGTHLTGFAQLKPNTPTVFGTFFIEMLGTFFFVYMIGMHKDSLAVRTLTPDGMLMKLSVVVTLYAMICIAAPRTGASFNPAVTMGLRALCVSQTDKDESCTKYTWVYLLADFLGGALAGIVTLCHRKPAKLYTDAAEELIKQEVEDASYNALAGHNHEKPMQVA